MTEPLIESVQVVILSGTEFTRNEIVACFERKGWELRYPNEKIDVLLFTRVVPAGNHAKLTIGESL